jgi:sugar/nucleoside kinase (ribokinase family)
LNDNNLWPYILPFPVEAEKRKLILAILQSRIGTNILTGIKIDANTFQRDLIGRLGCSNKSAINYLKQMVDAGVLEQGMKRVLENGKTAWTKWYAPTSLGKWIILFLTPPKEIPPEMAKQTIEELFRLYSSSVVEVCKKYGFTIDSFQQVFDEQCMKSVVAKGKKIEPKVVVYGSTALDIYGDLERLPSMDETVYVEETARHAGGMGANVAVALARLAVPVAFVGRIGSDFVGRILLESLVRNGIDVSDVIVTVQRSLRTLILHDRKRGRWLLAIGSPDHALSVTSPSEIDWNQLDQSQIVYVGEVFVEVALTIASYAESKGKVVIYRPGAPYLRFGLEKLQSVLEHVNIFIMNDAGWNSLQNSSKKPLKAPEELLAYGPETVILTKGEEGSVVYTREGDYVMPVSAGMRARFRTLDPTGAGDSLSAGLIKGLLQGWGLKKAISFGQAAACIKCSRIGTAPAFPTFEEVEAALRKNH